MGGSEKDSSEVSASTQNGMSEGEVVSPRSGVAKRGCLISKKFYLSADFDKESLGFEDFFDKGEED
jgi:hypothetical protein